MASIVTLRVGGSYAASGWSLLIPNTVRLTLRVEDDATGAPVVDASGCRFYAEFSDGTPATVIPGVASAVPGEWYCDVTVTAGPTLRVQALVNAPAVQSDLNEIALVRGIIPARGPSSTLVSDDGLVVTTEATGYLSALRVSDLAAVQELRDTDTLPVVQTDGVDSRVLRRASMATLDQRAADQGAEAAGPIATQIATDVATQTASEVVPTLAQPYVTAAQTAAESAATDSEAAQAAAASAADSVANAAPQYATYADLLAAAPSLPVGQPAVVYADPGGNTINGQYRKTSADLVRESDTLPVVSNKLAEATVDAGPYGIGGFEVALAAENSDGGLIPYLTTAGRLLQFSPAGAAESVPLRSELNTLINDGVEAVVDVAVESAVGTIVPPIVADAMDGVEAPIVLLNGEVPARVWLDPSNRIIRLETEAGSLYLAGTSGLVQVGGGAVGPVTTIPAYTTTVPGWNLRTGSVRYIILMHGQSNCEGVNSGTIIPGSIISSTALYPNDALMPSVGLRTGGARFTTLAPLVESNNGNRWETGASGCANHLIRDVEAALGIRPQLLFANTAVSGLTYAELTRGSQPYARLLLAAQDAVAACRTRGEIPIILGVDWVQGEAEVLLADEITRQRQLLQLQRWLDADLRAISGQSESVVLYITQTSHQLTSTSPVLNAVRQPITQTDAVLDGEYGIRTVSPLYPLPYGDQLHIASIGQYRRGQALSRAIAAEAFGTGWKPLKALSSRWVSSTQFEVEFSRSGLVIDTSGAVVTTTGIPGLYGWQFDDASGSPPALTAAAVQTETNRVLFTLASAPTGRDPRLGYATQRSSGSGGLDGPVVGARGLLRTSTGQTSIVDGTTQYDWALSQIIRL